MASLEALLPEGVRSRMLADVNGLDMHVLEAGHEEAGRPLLLLVHGFPELAFSWRHVMPALAAAGYHVVAPDQRGFGRTIGGDARYDCDLSPFSFLGKARDMVALVWALGHQTAFIAGHDLGSPVAAWSTLVRPDVFRAVALMSAPFPGPPPLGPDLHYGGMLRLEADLAALPRPRKYYVLWNCTPEAAADYDHAPQGLADFFRAYFHNKSGDWEGNRPFTLADRSAEQLARMPTYYMMERDKGMAETVAEFMPGPEQAAACRWLTDAEIAVFAAEYGRTGFQAPLNASYRMLTDPRNFADSQTFAGRTIDVPSVFISGARDWGNYQTVGAIETMQTRGCSRMTGVHLVEGAGHWVQQEKPDEVIALLLDFLGQVRAG